MRKLLRGVAVLGISLGLSGTALAKGGSHGGNHGGSHSSGAHSSHHGGSYSGGGHHHSAGSHDLHGYHSNHYGHHTDYHRKYGHEFHHGYYYRGRDHHHWSSQRWDDRYGCTVYYDPYVRGYYYWCEPDNCYYPVSYVPYDCYACEDAGEQVTEVDNDPPPPPPPSVGSRLKRVDDE